ncbi:MAG: hypothetical protein JSU72_17130 [Deltaproteobacteria bacterium]|nr:MAG: hypothetical protein JSU72_17130 [Deltaproteobacteria bacterium]
MLLRNHPKLQHQWPPDWIGLYNRDYKIPAGEKPERLIFVEESRWEPAIILTARYQGQKITAAINIEDAQFRSDLCRILQENVGKSIEGIGSLVVPL